MGNFGIATRARDLAPTPEGPATIQLGGVRLYAASEEKLNQGLALIGEAVSSQCGSLPSVDRAALQSLVCKQLGEIVEDRLFGAVLGQKMREGLIESIPCAAVNYKVFRVFVHRVQLGSFRRRLSELKRQLLSAGTMTVAEVRKSHFSDSQPSASSAAAHLFARLVLEGCATYGPRGVFVWPKGLEHALG